MGDDREFRPIPGDTSREQVGAFIDASAAREWILTASGEYTTAAVEAFTKDGANHQRLVLLEWPGRWNHTDDPVTVRLAISPEDALGLVEVLFHTARWMIAAEQIEGE